MLSLAIDLPLPAQAAADDRSDFGQQVASLRMKIRPTKTTFAVNEIVGIEIQVQNVSEKPIKIFSHGDQQLGYLATNFKVVTPRGKKLTLSQFGRAQNEFVPPPSITLQPAQISRQTIALNHWWPGRTFTQPGTYRISCQFHPFSPFGIIDFAMTRVADPATWSQLASPAISITIVRKGSTVTRPQAAIQNLVKNGSFEERQTGEPNRHIDTLTPDRKDLVGWQITGTSIDWIGPTRWTASDGKQCLDIDAPGGILQTIKTQPGTVYLLTFDLAGNAELDPAIKGLRVSIHGTAYDFSFDTTGHSRHSLGWSPRQIVFVATADKTRLAFSNLSEKVDSAGVALDNVVLQAYMSAQQPVQGDTVIRAPAGKSEIVITTPSRVAGAIHSLTWNGKEMLDSFDHGRQLQSAANFDLRSRFSPETFNPTEAGSSADGRGPTSTSRLLRIAASENQLETITQMAFWLKPGQRSAGKLAKNNLELSNQLLSKKVKIGLPDLPHVIQYDVTFTVPQGNRHRYAQFEAVTGYMPAEFKKFWKFNSGSGKLEPLSDGPGEQAWPVVLSTENGSHAMGVYSPDQPSKGYEQAGYGRFRFKGEKVTKWNCVFRIRRPEKGIAPGDYTYHCLVVVGDLATVEKTMQALHAR